jgi:hypothetical protein
MTRDLVSVIGDIEGVVPESEKRLHERLAAIRASARYTAPEAMRVRWLALEAVMVEEIGTPTEDWHRLISEIIKRG